MADTSVTANSGNNLGANFAVDAAGAVIWPYSKTAFGASGTQTEVSASNPLPIVANANATVILTSGNVTLSAPVTLQANANLALNAPITLQANANVVVSALTGGNVNANCNGNAVVTNAGTFAVQLTSTNKSLKTVSSNLSANANVIAIVSSKRLKVYALTVVDAGVSALPNLIIFKSGGNAGSELWRTFLQSNTNAPMGYAQSVTPPAFLFGTVAGEALTVVPNQSDNLHYSIAYWDDDAT